MTPAPTVARRLKRSRKPTEQMPELALVEPRDVAEVHRLSRGKAAQQRQELRALMLAALRRSFARARKVGDGGA